MVYILIVILQLIGIGLKSMAIVSVLSDKYPERTAKQIWAAFFGQDWDTLIVSGIIIALDLVGHYIINDYLHLPIPDDWYWKLMPFIIAITLGYTGQALVYKWLGTAAKTLDNSVTAKLGGTPQP